MGENKNNKIRISVGNFYRGISEGTLKTEVDNNDLSKSLGYADELLKKLPEEINMGLSCGNPLSYLNLDEGETLLDLGSGGGMDLFIARMKFPNAGTLYGLDILPEMIAKAEKVRDAKGFENIEFRQGTLTENPFESSSIDKAISNCVINLEPDKQKVYNELYRILKSGGEFYISDIILKQNLPCCMKNDERMLCTCVSGAILEEELLAIIHNAGFEDVKIDMQEVTDEYAQKWGYGNDIKKYIQRGIIVGKK